MGAWHPAAYYPGMMQLLAAALQWTLRKLGLLLLIVAALLAVSWLRAAWDEHAALTREIDRQANVLAGIQSELGVLDDEIALEGVAWQRRMVAATEPLKSSLATIDAQLDAAADGLRDAQALFADHRRVAGTARVAAREAKAEFDRLDRATWWWDSYLAPSKLVAREKARARYVALDQAARAAEATSRQAAAQLALVRRHVGGLQQQREATARDIHTTLTSESPRQAELRAAQAGKSREASALEGQLAARRTHVATNPREQLIGNIRSKLPVALGILVGLLLLPALLKTFLYFAIAPLAGRLRPVRILPRDGQPAFPEPARSAVSVAIEVEPGFELLVQPDFLQSSSHPARKSTRWFLNPRLPFASIASGLFAITAIRPEGEASTRVVVSALKDPFGEVGVIEIPAGAAMVVQPRALAGVVKPDGRPMHITRHWRLGSLHAWLTLQLRYLVFHGPCRLILKGCRGVRAEEPRAGQPRMINQAATIGFSANLDYRTTRCETFIPYLRGKAELFDDQFAGGPGRFVYEEVPGGNRRAGLTGRGLEGLMDGVLKAFGI
jgi:hypothetical protein